MATPDTVEGGEGGRRQERIAAWRALKPGTKLISVADEQHLPWAVFLTEVPLFYPTSIWGWDCP